MAVRMSSSGAGRMFIVGLSSLTGFWFPVCEMMRLDYNIPQVPPPSPTYYIRQWFYPTSQITCLAQFIRIILLLSLRKVYFDKG